VADGNTSAAKNVTLTKHENVALNFSASSPRLGFAVASNTCSPSIAGGANCTVGVTFSPATTGVADARATSRNVNGF
jgi:hypothetical protein